jgi:hypothetical protein
VCFLTFLLSFYIMLGIGLGVVVYITSLPLGNIAAKFLLATIEKLVQVSPLLASSLVGSFVIAIPMGISFSIFPKEKFSSDPSKEIQVDKIEKSPGDFFVAEKKVFWCLLVSQFMYVQGLIIIVKILQIQIPDTSFWAGVPLLVLMILIGLPSKYLNIAINDQIEFWQHLPRRFVLYAYSQVIPWNYAQFLNYCTERRLLQRIGGRYRFIHRELLDHFARL